MQHQANGVGAAANNGMNVLSGLAQAGQQMDINILYNLVLQLSEELARNREYVASLVSSVHRLEARAAEEGTSPTVASASADLSSTNNITSSTTTSRQQIENSRLQDELSLASRTIDTLNESNTAYSDLLLEHGNALSSIVEKIRPYAHSHTDHILALHKHYNGIIAQERREKLDLRLEQQQWQSGLGRVAEYARMALKETNDGNLGLARRVARLKEENRVLRKLAGVEEGWDSSEEEEGEVRMDMQEQR